MTCVATDCSVLVVDDSAFMRKLIGEMIAGENGFHVAGFARNGVDALAKIRSLDPDIVTLDLEMPELDGMLALEQIMAKAPRPVIVLSAGGEQFGDATMRALELGAIEFVRKPGGPISLELGDAAGQLSAALAAASRARRPVPQQATRRARPIGLVPEGTSGPIATAASAVVLIASSTGGPRALMEIIPALPAGLEAAVVIAQHLPPDFANALVERLGGASSMRVRLATDGDILESGCVYVAAGGRDTEVIDDAGRRMFRSIDSASGATPCADVMFTSAAQVFGPRVVGVVLTGMGRDGSVGLRAVRRAGGLAIVQDEQSSAIYGMPRAALALAGADRVVPLSEVAERIVEMVAEDRKACLTA